MSDISSPRALRFGDFELDVRAYELRRRGRRVKVERLAMDLLIFLVEHQGQLVTRSAIVGRLWGKDVFVDVDASVNTLVRKIRRVLNDAADRPRFLETVQGKGYRFIADVEVILAPPVSTQPAPARAPTPQSGDLEPETSPLTGGHAPRRARVLTGSTAAALIVLMLVIVAGRSAWSRLDRGAGGATVRVAVMPFENLTGDPDLAYLAEGIAEDTAASLGQILESDRVTIVGRMSTAEYKSAGKSRAEIARELAADYLVVGSVQAESQQLRITSSLVRVRDQGQVWSYSYDPQPGSVLGMQRELGAMVAQQVRQQLSPERLDGLTQRQTQSADAYDLYLRGRHFWNQLTPPTTKRALEAYGRATALDEHYALAWAGIADAYTTGPIMGDARPEAVRGASRHAAERALQTGGMLAEPQTSAGVQRFFLEWDWPGAEAALRRAIRIDPGYAMAHRLLGVVLSHSNRHDEARVEMRRARDLEPHYAMNHALSAMAEFHAGDMNAAVAHARQALAFDHEFWIAHYHLAQAYERLGQDELAFQALANATRLSQHGNSKPLSVKGYLLARRGRTGEAGDVLDALEKLSESRYVPPYASALVYAGLENRDAAFAWLDRAFAERDVHLIFLPVDPKWNPMREDPRFQDLLRRCGFPSGP